MPAFSVYVLISPLLRRGLVQSSLRFFASVVVIRKRAVCRFLRRVFADLVQRNLDCFFKLRVTALPPEFRIEIDLDIRRNALILDVEFTLSIAERNTRSRDRTAIDQRRITVDADKAAPRAFADQLSDLCRRKSHGIRSPPEPAYSLIIIVFGP